MKEIIPIIVFVLCLPLGLADSWSNSQGRVFEAEFVRNEGTSVIFRLPGGREFSHSLLDLSPESQSAIRERASSPIEDLRSNFGRPWPQQAAANGNPACKIISEDSEKSHYTYESPSYRFHCDARITHDRKGLHAGKSGREALAPLLGSGDFKKLEAEITAAWSRKGINIRFGE